MLTNGEAPMPVIEAEKVKTKKTYTNSGHVIASLAHIEHRPTFTDVSLRNLCYFVALVSLCPVERSVPVILLLCFYSCLRLYQIVVFFI